MFTVFFNKGANLQFINQIRSVFLVFGVTLSGQAFRYIFFKRHSEECATWLPVYYLLES